MRPIWRKDTKYYRNGENDSMKKIILIALALMLALGCASAEANLHAAAVNHLRADENVSCLQFAGDDVYYVYSEENGDDEYRDILYKMDANGNAQAIASPLRRGADYAYAGNFAYLSNYTTWNGYGDMVVYGDSIYYVGNGSQSGSYETVALGWNGEEGKQVFETAYDSQASIYRMDLNGGNKVELISGLGNGTVHMDIAADRIAVASCYRNAIYPYHFSNFMFYDLEGNLLEVIANESGDAHSWIYKEEEAFTAIVEGIQTDGKTIWASLGDSEGDFVSSRFVDVKNHTETIAFEAFYVQAEKCDRGLVYLGSEVEDIGWAENFDSTITLRLRADDGSETILAKVPQAHVSYSMDVSVAGEYAYLRVNETLVRVPLDGGAAEMFEGEGFVPAPAFDLSAGIATLEWTEESAADEYLLPDSDTRLYTADELKDYDKDTLALMRNEILARHGYPFQKEKYKEYFGSKNWYTADPAFDYGSLNSTEMANVETIKGLE